MAQPQKTVRKRVGPGGPGEVPQVAEFTFHLGIALGPVGSSQDVNCTEKVAFGCQPVGFERLPAAIDDSGFGSAFLA